jgi:Tol biopolymer transport system component
MSAPNRRLNSWKEIADYLGRGLTTVRRWEVEKGLPVRRIPGGSRQAVFALTEEIDQWLMESGGERNGSGPRQALAPPRWRRWALVAAAFVGLAATAGLILYLWPVRAPRVLKIRQITEDGSEKQAPVVTDGWRVYFTRINGAGLEICQSPLSGGRASAVPGTADLMVRDISPDGTALLAAKAPPPGGMPQLYLVPLRGGAPYALGVYGNAAAWSLDGRRLAYANEAGLYTVGIGGGEGKRLVEAAGISSIRWSPDGKRLRVNRNEAGRASLWEIGVEGGLLMRVQPQWNSTRSDWMPAWIADGRYSVVIRSRNAAGELWALRESPGIWGEPVRQGYQLTDGPVDYSGVAAARDGRHLYALGLTVKTEFRRLDVRSGQFAAWLEGVSADGVTFSPDGRWVAYSVVPGRTLWRSRVDGGELQQLTTAGMEALLPRWSPDGRMLAFMGRAASREGNWNIYVMPAAGGVAEPVLAGDAHHASPTWSPDGNSLAFAGAPWMSGFSPESTAVNIVDLRARQVTAVPSSKGLWAPKWSPDGRYLAAQTTDSFGIMLYDIGSRQWGLLYRVEGPAPIGYVCWSRAGDYLYFNTAESIRRIRVPHGTAEVVAQIEMRLAQTLGQWFGLGPDDAPLVLRDASRQEIYELEVDFP